MLTQDVLQHVAGVIRSGGVIAYPTESVYGLGCDPNNLQALQKILKIKNRPNDKGFIILVSDIQQAAPFIESLSEDELNQVLQPRRRATTWLIKKKKQVPELLSGEFDTIAVRLTQHPIAKAICKMTGQALVSTSCNLSGEKEHTNAADVKEKMPTDIDYIVDGDCGGERPSQIIDLASGRVLRD